MLKQNYFNVYDTFLKSTIILWLMYDSKILKSGNTKSQLSARIGCVRNAKVHRVTVSYKTRES